MTKAQFVFVSILGKWLYFSANQFIYGPGWAHGPVDYGFYRAGPGLGLEYMGSGWSGPRVGEPVANTGEEWSGCRPVVCCESRIISLSDKTPICLYQSSPSRSSVGRVVTRNNALNSPSVTNEARLRTGPPDDPQPKQPPATTRWTEPGAELPPAEVRSRPHNSARWRTECWPHSFGEECVRAACRYGRTSVPPLVGAVGSGLVLTRGVASQNKLGGGGAEQGKTTQSTINMLEIQISPRIWHTFSLKSGNLCLFWPKLWGLKPQAPQLNTKLHPWSWRRVFTCASRCRQYWRIMHRTSDLTDPHSNNSW